MSSTSLRIGFLGTGKMATAMAVGFAGNGIKGSNIFAANPNTNSLKAFRENVSPDMITATGIDEWPEPVDVLFLAVKPYMFAKLLPQISKVIDSSVLVVSVAAGISIQQLEGWLPDGQRVIRVMPNTPCLIGQGVSGVSCGTNASEEDLQTIESLMQSVGRVVTVEEPLLDAITGLSGSGPAYVFQMIEALSDGGVKMGLKRETATELAAQTLLGAAMMVLETGKHPGQLKDEVTSPGGTTIAALHALEKGGLRSALMDAVEASAKRSRELS